MNKLIQFGVIFISLIISQTIQAQSSSAFEKSEMSTSSGTLLFRILYPEAFDISEEYPLVLFLHGSGERGDDNEKQLVHGSELFLDSQNREEYPSIVIFPQCPEDSFWSNVEMSRNFLGELEFEFPGSGEPTEAMQNVLDLLDSMVRLEHVDRDKVYVGGLSMGGMGTFEIIRRRSNIFAAAISICGGGNVEVADNYARKMNFWVFHGAKDDVVPPEYSTKMVSAIKEAGGEVKYTLYPDAKHNSWNNAFSEPDLLPWLFSQSK